MDRRKYPQDQIGWGWYNFGLLWGVETTRKQAIKEIEKITGETWKEAQKFTEVHKVRVSRVYP